MSNNISILFFLLALFSIKSLGQTELDAKISSLDGEITKIIIQSDKQTISLEGEDAKELLERIKNNSEVKHLKLYVYEEQDSNSLDKGTGIIFDSSDEDEAEVDSIDSDIDLIVLNGDDLDIDEESNINKKVQVVIENGIKKITVTTIENGSRNIEVFEGEDADKYLKEHEINVIDQSEGTIDKESKKIKKIIIQKETK